MLRITVNKSVPAVLSERAFALIARQAARVEKKVAGTVEINIVSESAIKALNKNYRGLSKVTDVLAFAWQEDPTIRSKMLGQVYLCQAQIRRQAKDFKVSVAEETVRMLAHGLLHLAGHDHLVSSEAKRMFTKQEIIVDRSLKLIRSYGAMASH